MTRETEVYNELKDQFGEEMANKFKGFTFHWVLDWKDNPMEMLQELVDAFGLELKKENIGDADLILVRKIQ